MLKLVCDKTAVESFLFIIALWVLEAFHPNDSPVLEQLPISFASAAFLVMTITDECAGRISVMIPSWNKRRGPPLPFLIVVHLLMGVQGGAG